MIAAGEAGGILDTILKRLAVYIEKNVKLKGDVKSAMIYPIAVIVIAALVVGAILWKVIPTFATLFAGLGAQLPLPTRIVIAMSNGVVAWGWLIIVGLGAAGWVIGRYYATANGRAVIDALLLKTPILGNILRKVAVARFCRTLSTLLSSGVPILDGLDITGRTAGNAVVEAAIQKTRSGIERGETISGPLRETNVFPSMVVQMINVGETTGALDAMLSKIADFYEDEVDTAVAGMLTLMEPVMIAFLGVVVGGIVIAMYLPIFDLISKLSQLADGHVPIQTAVARDRPRGGRDAAAWVGDSGAVRRAGRAAGDPFFLLIALTYALTAGYGLLLKRAEQRPWIVDAQLAIDALLVSALVALPAGSSAISRRSISLPIIAASAVRSRRGSVTVGILSAAIYPLLVAAQYGGGLRIGDLHRCICCRRRGWRSSASA